MEDLRDEAMKVFVETDDKKKQNLRATFINVTVPSYLNRFEKIYNENPGPWLVGTRVTWADIFIVYSFDYLSSTLGEENLIMDYPGLQALKETVYGIPEISEYIKNRPEGSY